MERSEFNQPIDMFLTNKQEDFLRKRESIVMNWSEPKYSKTRVNKAGDYFKGDKTITEDEALKIFDNWRAAHSYPMQVFNVRLINTAKTLDSNSLVSQRLKRASSIIAKLNRKYDGRSPTMQLSQMQDIGGCRAILSDVSLARKLSVEKYEKGDLKHKLVKKNDYITNPKSDGYRGIHLIYSYKSDKNKKQYNGLLVEVQIRSKLQHLWATAVETVGFFTRQAIKSSEGTPEWNEFFKLVSSAFATKEDCMVVPNTPTDQNELFKLIAQKENELGVIDKIKRWTSTMRILDDDSLRRGAKFFLLRLNINDETLRIHRFTKQEEQKALDMYASLEKEYSKNRDYDIVLAGVDKAHDLKKAYPNYYADMGEFIQKLEEILKKA